MSYCTQKYSDLIASPGYITLEMMCICIGFITSKHKVNHVNLHAVWLLLQEKESQFIRNVCLLLPYIKDINTNPSVCSVCSLFAIISFPVRYTLSTIHTNRCLFCEIRANHSKIIYPLYPWIICEGPASRPHLTLL